MSKLSHASLKTLIIQPGSAFLRIGLATDEKPKVFLHCIARESKKPGVKTSSSIFQHVNSVDYNPKDEVSISDFVDFPLPNNNFHVDNELIYALNASTNESASRLATNSPFIPFLRGFRKCASINYDMHWPITSGHFDHGSTPSKVLQDLEDMWTYAITHYLDIPRETFHLYSVILLIEDIFVRREVRQIVNMLLTNFNFSKVVVQQSSVCATYGVGLPTACVVDFGAQKTSISCVDEGVSVPDVRVTLPVGTSDCLRTFHAATKYYSKENQELNDLLQKIGYHSFADTKVLFNKMFEADAVLTTRVQSSQSVNEASEVIQLEVIPEHRLTLPIKSIITAHLVPYFPKSVNLVPEYQPSIGAPEPDDPFDEVYIMTTAREKKRKLQIEGISAKGDEAVSDQKIPKVQRLSSFRSLAEAIIWSIRQASVVASSVALGATESELTGIHVNDGKSEQLRYRLLGCILLVGGGATNLGGYLISKWLTKELQALVGDGNTVEVLLRPQGVSDLAWQGAKLMLNTDSISDLWITPADWLRYGSRILREKSPFPW